jgi:hypothetical protein
MVSMIRGTVAVLMLVMVVMVMMVMVVIMRIMTKGETSVIEGFSAPLADAVAVVVGCRLTVFMMMMVVVRVVVVMMWCGVARVNVDMISMGYNCGKSVGYSTRVMRFRFSASLADPVAMVVGNWMSVMVMMMSEMDVKMISVWYDMRMECSDSMRFRFSTSLADSMTKVGDGVRVVMMMVMMSMMMGVVVVVVAVTEVRIMCFAFRDCVLVGVFGVPLEVVEMREVAVMMVAVMMMVAVVVMVTEEPVAMSEPVAVAMSITVTMGIWFRFGTAFHKFHDIVGIGFTEKKKIYI